jgi:hypothetical protein
MQAAGRHGPFIFQIICFGSVGTFFDAAAFAPRRVAASAELMTKENFQNGKTKHTT